MDQHITTNHLASFATLLTQQIQPVWIRVFTGNATIIPKPNVVVGPDGQIHCVWNDHHHHLELEMYPTGMVEWFYWNRQTNALWEGELAINESIPDTVLSELSIAASIPNAALMPNNDPVATIRSDVL
jgi:hypothetical protein